jgi:hypothetical protein
MSVLLALVMIGLGAEPTDLNSKVVAFARSKVGQKVGAGECSDLAIAALRAAGGRLPGRGAGWGEERPSLNDARPGDVLQFENAVFVRRRLRPDGALVTLTFSYPHHTAVVSGVRKRGRGVVVTVLHQNAGAEEDDDEARKVVQEWVVDPAEQKGGTVKAYRPVAE